MPCKGAIIAFEPFGRRREVFLKFVIVANFVSALPISPSEIVSPETLSRISRVLRKIFTKETPFPHDKFYLYYSFPAFNSHTLSPI
eukprot:gene4980-3575_t